MEWVEFNASTLEGATQLAADGLGLDASALEIEILEEPVAGLFGRVRGTARIRARAAGSKAVKAGKAAPAKAARVAKAPAPSASSAGKQTRVSSGAEELNRPVEAVSRATRPKASGSALAVAAAVAAAPVKASADRRPAAARRTPPPARAGRVAPSRVGDEPVDMDAVVESSKRFLGGLLDAAGLQGTISHRVVDEQTVEMSMSGDGLGMLVGPKGQTLLAAQELLRTFVHHDTGGRSGRLMLDVAGYREKRRAALQIFTKQVAESVVSTGERRVLEPMNAVDRKVIHDTVAGLDGVSSISEGEDPQRYVVLLPE